MSIPNALATLFSLLLHKDEGFFVASLFSVLPFKIGLYGEDFPSLISTTHTIVLLIVRSLSSGSTCLGGPTLNFFLVFLVNPCVGPLRDAMT